MLEHADRPRIQHLVAEHHAVDVRGGDAGLERVESPEDEPADDERDDDGSVARSAELSADLSDGDGTGRRPPRTRGRSLRLRNAARRHA
jgi:hypothetical protein